MKKARPLPNPKRRTMATMPTGTIRHKSKRDYNRKRIIRLETE